MAERRYTVLLYTAVLTAVVATFGVYRVLQHQREANRVAMRPVMVASKDLPQGASLTSGTIETKQLPAGLVPVGSYAKPDSLIGRVTSVAVYKGEVILPGRLAPTGTGPGLEVKITPGKRAMALKINDVAGISGLVQPNSRVDVVVTMRKTDTTSTPISKVFMQDMRVLSMGTTVERDAEGKAIKATTATLEVTPEEAERLAVASTQGTIQLVLRGYGDATTVKTTGAYTKDVIAQFAMPDTTRRAAPVRVRRESSGEVVRRKPPVVVQQAAPVVQAPPPPPPPKPESLAVTIIRGDKSNVQKFPKDTAKQPQ